jgi:RNA recognition motif-containing protein
LFNLFKAYGSIKSAKVRRQKCGLVEKPLGCGFVDFESPEEANLARLGKA